jgi:hypothetical protein
MSVFLTGTFFFFCKIKIIFNSWGRRFQIDWVEREREREME